MLKIYGADLSAPANKVRFAANALDLPYEYIRVKIRDGENRTEAYLKLHPAGKVPVIDDDGFVLFESNAIIKYLAAQAHSPLYPEDKKQRALIDQWIDFTVMHVGNALSKVLFNRVFAPIIPVPVDERSVEEGQKFLNRFLPVIEQQMEKESYLAGENFSLADIVLLATLDPAEVAGISLGRYPRTVKWRDELKQKPFYTKCHREYGETLQRMREARA